MPPMQTKQRLDSRLDTRPSDTDTDEANRQTPTQTQIRHQTPSLRLRRRRRLDSDSPNMFRQSRCFDVMIVLLEHPRKIWFSMCRWKTLCLRIADERWAVDQYKNVDRVYKQCSALSGLPGVLYYILYESMKFHINLKGNDITRRCNVPLINI